MKLQKIEDLTGTITCMTGLRIGGTRETVGIGEMDNPIIRHPLSRHPYVPGSSLKGKLRSLLEMRYSEFSQRTGRPCECGNCEICRMFGCGNARNTTEPTRLIFRDAFLSKASVEALEEGLPGSYAEVKTELRMDRKTGAASDGGNRQTERVPEGTIFDFSISMRLFEEDTAERRRTFLARLAEAFELLERDYLGGNGTRGYGKVMITHDGKPMADYLKALNW